MAGVFWNLFLKVFTSALKYPILLFISVFAELNIAAKMDGLANIL